MVTKRSKAYLFGTCVVCAVLCACTPAAWERVGQVAGAEVGATAAFRWQRNSKFRIAAGSRLYVPVLAATPTVPSHQHRQTFRDITANDLPWRLARLVAHSWADSYAVQLGDRPEAFDAARASAKATGATYVLAPRLRRSEEQPSIWNRDNLVIELVLTESATGREVDRMALHARAALTEDELDDVALQEALRRLAAAVSGQSGVHDDRFGHLL